MNGKRAIITALSIALACVVLYQVYYIFFHNESFYLAVESEVESDVPEHALVGQTDATYDFKRMLKLMDQARQTKKAFQAQFRAHTSRRIGPLKPVDIQETRELLADLYREKIRLSRYMFDVQARFRGDPPYKRKRLIRHYQSVVDDCIKDMESILRRV